MTARLLDGRAVASHVWRELSHRVEALRSEEASVPPRLAIIRFGEAGPPAIYASSLERAARSIGIEPLVVTPSAGASRTDLGARVEALNRDASVAGIVIAQPLPARELANLVDHIDPAKDVDGATPTNAGRLARGEAAFAPATALAVMELLAAHDVPLAGRRAVVVGRSSVVGRPTAALLLAADATVIVCHRGTRNLARETRRAEIVVAAAGSPRLIRAEMLNRSAVVVDCGINTTPDGLVGDVDFEAVRPVVAAITPVPGGVGAVTTMMVLRQTVQAAESAAVASAADESMMRFDLPAPERTAG